MAKAKKAVASSASIHKKISTAIESLNAAWSDAEAAVAARSKAAKKATAEVKKLSKKRATLAKSKKRATAKHKKESTTATHKVVKAVTKEIAAVKKVLDKAKIEKAAHAAELAAVKAGHRVATAYTKVIEKADKVLNKPKKKVRRKKRAKKAA